MGSSGNQTGTRLLRAGERENRPLLTRRRTWATVPACEREHGGLSMKPVSRFASALLVCVALLSSCRALPEEETAVEKSATVEAIKGTNLNRVKVTAKA